MDDGQMYAAIVVWWRDLSGSMVKKQNYEER